MSCRNIRKIQDSMSRFWLAAFTLMSLFFAPIAIQAIGYWGAPVFDSITFMSLD